MLKKHLSLFVCSVLIYTCVPLPLVPSIFNYTKLCNNYHNDNADTTDVGFKRGGDNVVKNIMMSVLMKDTHIRYNSEDLRESAGFECFRREREEGEGEGRGGEGEGLHLVA